MNREDVAMDVTVQNVEILRGGLPRHVPRRIQQNSETPRQRVSHWETRRWL